MAFRPGYQPPKEAPADEKKTPAWKKRVHEMTPDDIVTDGTRQVALSIIPTEFPLLHQSEENLDKIDEAVERRYKGIWTPETVRYSIQYEREHLLWDKPPAPIAPPLPPKPVYDEGPLEDWQLPLSTPEWKMRSASVNKEQMKDLVQRLHRYEEWKKQNEQ